MDDSVEKETQLERVIGKLRSDGFACDLRMCLFVAALESYRHDSILRPYPPVGLREDGSKNIQKLTNLSSSIPSLSALNNDSCLEPGVWSLLDWVLLKKFDVKTLDKSMFQEIEKKTGHSSYNSTEPDYIFEIQYHENNALNARFLALSEECEVLYAYHGSRLENFHSILHNGLHSHLNKNSLFGEGTYLSSDLNVSIMYSTYSQAWSNSGLGEKLSCVAVCEVLNHPDVKCSLEDPRAATSSVRARAKGSEGGDVPDRYYVVQNNQLLRVKYLLVYAEKR
ncbi:predicted protein, partial [Nematostella vectensis]